MFDNTITLSHHCHCNNKHYFLLLQTFKLLLKCNSINHNFNAWIAALRYNSLKFVPDSMNRAVKYLLLFAALLAENWISKHKELLYIPNILMMAVSKQTTGLCGAFFTWQSCSTILACVQHQDFTRICLVYLPLFFMHSQDLTEV